MARIVLEIGDLRQDAGGAPSDLLTLGGERDPAAGALHQGRLEAGLQLLDLHRKGGLADRALLRRPAEMAVPGQARRGSGAGAGWS